MGFERRMRVCKICNEIIYTTAKTNKVICNKCKIERKKTKVKVSQNL